MGELVIKQEFADAIRILVDSLPTQNVEKRINALWEFYGNTRVEVLQRAARECARRSKNFPSPGEFREWVEMYQPVENKEYHVLKPPIPENEMGERIVKMNLDPKKCMLAILSQVDGREDKISEKPLIAQKMYRTLKEMIGENLMKEIREEYQNNRGNAFLSVMRQL